MTTNRRNFTKLLTASRPEVLHTRIEDLTAKIDRTYKGMVVISSQVVHVPGRRQSDWIAFVTWTVDNAILV